LISVVAIGMIFVTSIAIVFSRKKNERENEKQKTRAQQEKREKAEKERAERERQAKKEQAQQESQNRATQSNTSSSDPFEVLGLPRNATREEVREAFLRLSKEWHPDKFAKHGDPKVMQMAHENYIKIKNAYEQIIKMVNWS
jgi:DnaJ-domain-containing protein 1